MVGVNVSVTRGHFKLTRTVGLFFEEGSLDFVTNVVFTASLENANKAVGSITYQPTQGWYGMTSLHVEVDDQGYSGAGGKLSTKATVPIVYEKKPVIPPNVGPKLTLPPPVFQTSSESFYIAGWVVLSCMNYFTISLTNRFTDLSFALERY